MKPKHGLVIGKFYPPHAGHHLLVRAAADNCRRVTVVVMAASTEGLSLADRVAWLREIHASDPNVTVVGEPDDHPVDYEDPAAWDAHVAVMKRGLAQVTNEPVDAVFTSEAYGAELARRFQARHALVDLPRAWVPVSGTAIRNDPVAQWTALASPVRGGLARRIALVGAESTGKTTLARELAEALAARGGAHALTRWVPEYGRDYSVRKAASAAAAAALVGERTPSMADLAWTSADFDAIARRQAAWEDEAARAGGPVVFLDTDVFATAIWHERYRGSRSVQVEALASERRPALYLLTHHEDVPFVADGVRDGESIRGWMTERFAQRLQEDARPFVVIRGRRAERLEAALFEVERVLREGWPFEARFAVAPLETCPRRGSSALPPGPVA